MPTSDTSVEPAGEDRRSVVTAAILVGLVVLLLGFGSGIGAVWERDASSSAAAAPSSTSVPRGLSSAVRPGESPSTRGGRVGAGPVGGSTTSPPTTSAHHPAGSTTSTTSATTTTDAPRGAGPPCDTTDLVAAIAGPFWAHFEAAHLETSPGQQAADAADVDRYVLTHTVLVEHMLAPVVELVLALTEAPDPFIAHVDAAHLETSVGHQIAEVLQVDQYVRTHSVLVEQMLDPAASAVTATGC